MGFLRERSEPAGSSAQGRSDEFLGAAPSIVFDLTERKDSADMTMDSRNRWLALIVLCLGTLMIVLDTTIVNVALPSIRADLGFSQTSLAWVVNAYLLTFGGFLLLGGRLGDLYGHRRLFIFGHRRSSRSPRSAAVSRRRRVFSKGHGRSRVSAARSRPPCRSR